MAIITETYQEGITGDGCALPHTFTHTIILPQYEDRTIASLATGRRSFVILTPIRSLCALMSLTSVDQMSYMWHR